MKLVRITTIPLSMRLLISGQPAFMKASGFDVVLISSEGPDWSGIPDLGDYRVYKIGMARRVRPWKDLLALVRLIRVFLRERPDIVHSHTPKAGLLSMLAARLSGVPVRLHTVAGLPLMESRGLGRGVLELAEWVTYRCANGVFPNSFRLRDFILKERLADPSKVKVIAGGSSNGIDMEYFRITPELKEQAVAWREAAGIPRNAPVFVFIGRIVRDKGIHELVDAFAALPDPEARLVLIGSFDDDDPVGDSVRKRIDGDNRIICPGFQRDVRPFLAASDVLVFPSYREGFPNAPLQAGCFNLPSIVTDINGCNEIIADGINGLIVPPKNVKALLVAMERLISDAPLRVKLGSAARALIAEKYQQSVVWAALLQEYRDRMG